MLRAQGSPFI